MKRPSTLKTLFFLFMFLYPFLIFWGLKVGVSLRLLSLFFLSGIFCTFFRLKKRIVLLIGFALLFGLFISNDPIFVRFYPVCMNGLFAATFLLSLKSTPIVEIFAKKMGKHIDDKAKKYTYNVTVAWGIFLSFNALASLITVFSSIEIWTFYNGFLSYILIGIASTIEYLIRKRVEQCS